MTKDINNESGTAIVEIVLLVVMVVVIGAVGLDIRRQNQKTASNDSISSQSSKSVGIHTPLASGDDNASLASDLVNINSSVTQTNQDSSSSQTALNDQQQEITVPTN